jgi:amino acid transporter
VAYPTNTPDSTASESAGLTREMGFFPALAANMLDMVGVGPFITIPLILSTMGGPQALLGWVVGAAIALCDGLVWAELGAAMPGSGGSYEYLQQAYGPDKAGRLMGFLFLWQVMLAAPLTAASGAVGLADYARYLVPALTHPLQVVLAIAVCGLSTWLLYRDIRSIGFISGVLWLALMAAIGIIVFGGATHFNPAIAFAFPPNAFKLSPAFFAGLGAAALISSYDFSGYFNVCLIGGEIKRPAVNIPRTIIYSVVVLAVLYLAMSFAIIGVIPAAKAMNSTAIVSDFTAAIYGQASARFMTGLILVIAFASVFCVLLGFTRVPYAAAVEGRFFSVFGRVHPKLRFPSFSVLFFGVASAAACLLSLDELIKGLIVIQIVTQFVAQCFAVVLIRRRRQDIKRPFAMPLYPLPVIVASLGWLYILLESGPVYISSGLALVGAGVLVYMLRARSKRDWPFVKPEKVPAPPHA